MLSGAGIGKEAAFAKRDRDTSNRNYCQKGHLKAGLKQGRGRPYQNTESSCAESIQDVAVSRQQTCQQKDRCHKKCALHRSAETCQECISKGERDGQEGCERLAQLQLSSKP